MQTQVALLLHIIKTNFAELQLAKVFCQVLTITESAAYRKLNGKSDITVAEFFKLLQNFKIDSSLFLNDENTYNFEGKLVYKNDTNVEQYFKDTLVFLEKIENQNGILYNLSKDVIKTNCSTVKSIIRVSFSICMMENVFSLNNL